MFKINIENEWNCVTASQQLESSNVASVNNAREIPGIIK